MENVTPYLFLIGAGIFLWLIIYYYLLRAIFSVKRQLWNQKQIIELLIRLVESQEGKTDQLDHIRERNNNPNANLD